MKKINHQPKTEKDWYQFWEKSNLFKADPKSFKKPYSLLMPPPNLTGELHLGHAMQHIILDALARYKRMQGYDVLLLPGVDHAGILFEGTFNRLLEKEGLSKEKLGRKKWLEKAWQFKDEVYRSFHQDWTLLGISADFSKEVFTLDEKRQKAVFEQFKRYWEDGLIYQGAYIVQWCPKCNTALEDVEMEYEEKKEKLYFVKYLVKGKNAEYITVATARPETIFADVAIAVYPNHPNYKKFVGKFAINPLGQVAGDQYFRLVIFEDERVNKEFGTGALKITPGHDLLDYQIGKTHNLPVLHVIDKAGRIVSTTRAVIEEQGINEDFSGLAIHEARNKAVEILERVGAIEKVEEYTHSVPVCERCKTTIEPLISQEWFVKMKPLADKALKNLKSINFIPKNYQKIISDWLKEVHDWCISRNLWWGHRIPIWYQGDEIKVSFESPGEGWVQEEKILDTWFSSGLWPLSTLGWPFDSAQGKPSLFKKYFPWDFEISAPEIKYLWIARMIMISLYLENQIPFKNMFFHGMLRDLQGRKFSKSLGNGIDSKELIKNWGVNAVRGALYSHCAPGRDSRTSKQIMDERCKNFRNFETKLRNIFRFIIELQPKKLRKTQKTSKPVRQLADQIIRNSDLSGISDTLSLSESFRTKHPDDKKIIEDLNKTIKSVTGHLEKFQLHLALDILYNFIWHEFADVYLEKSKKRRVEAQVTLEYVLKTSLKLLHPFMPFITEELWQELPHEGKSIMLAKWPEII